MTVEPNWSTDVASDELTAGLCPRCAGSGRDPDSTKIACWKCSGQGAVVLRGARIPASITADAVAALKLAVGHIEHMSAWIAGQNVGYPLEGLGEDLPGIRAALSAAAHPLPQGEAGPVDDRVVAWLIERKRLDAKHQPHWYVENEDDGWHWWTPDASQAKRFGTEQEARAFPPFQMIASDPDISVTEHVFLSAAHPSPQGEAGPVDEELTAGLCPRCAGTGRDPDSKKISCWKCSGTGAVVLHTHPLGDAGETEPGDLVEPTAYRYRVRGDYMMPWQYALRPFSNDAYEFEPLVPLSALSSLRAERDLHKQGWDDAFKIAAEKQRADDAESDATRLHSEKMDAIDARLAAEQRVVELERRLEIDHCFVMVDGEPELVRREIPPEERATWPDGITCRDATIQLLEEDKAASEQRVAALEGALTNVRTRLLIARQTGTLNTDWHSTLVDVEAVLALRPAETGEPK